MKPSEIESNDTCTLCGGKFQFGPKIYDGHYLPEYQAMVCKQCVPHKNSDVPPAYEYRLKEHCRKLGIPGPIKDVDGRMPALPSISIRKFPN